MDDAEIMVSGAFKAVLRAKTCFVVAIFNFQLYGGDRWSDSVVPAIFEIGILKIKKIVQIFIFFSWCAHLQVKIKALLT